MANLRITRLPFLFLTLALSAIVSYPAVPPRSFDRADDLLSTTVVISQVFSGGGGASGAWNRDYIELHNISAAPVLLDGLALQYGSATGNFGSAGTLIYSFPAGITLPVGGYYLIQAGTTAGINVNPTTPDQTTTNLAMAAGSGKVALTNTAVGLACGATATPCTLPDARIIDLVAWGTSNNGEGGTSVNNGVALSAIQTSARYYSGCTERDNNNLDFQLFTHTGMPPANTFRNSASPVFICGVTAAGVTLGGRVADSTGRGLGRVMITISGGSLTEPVRSMTNPFGYYRFEDLTVGATYIMTVNSKQYTFSPNSRIISLTDEATDIDFTADAPAGSLFPSIIKKR